MFFKKKNEHIKKIKYLVMIVLAISLISVGAVFFNNFFIKTYYNDYGIAHLTRSDMNSFQKSIKNTSVRAPKYNQESLMKDVPSSHVFDAKTQKMVDVPVWDTWPVQNPDGTIAEFHGYRLAIGLTSVGSRNDNYGTHLGMYIQKISDDSNDINSWQYIGNVFNSLGEGKDANNKDYYLSKIQSEWAGSTILMNPNDNELRIFYTNVMVKGNLDQSQALTTAKITLEPKENGDWNSGIIINHDKTTDKKTLFAGDGKIYQNVQQASNKDGDFYDSFAMRDPHFVEDNGKYYLIFEGNAGPESGGEGISNFNNRAYWGTHNLFDFSKQRKALLKDKNNSEYVKTYYANAAIGKLELNSDFTVKKVMKPIMTANGTHDVVERPNVFKYQGKWYLFADLTAKVFASNDSRFENQSYMIGYSSDNGINGKYTPLNGNGLVLSSSAAIGTKNYTYSFYPIKPNGKNKNVVVTSFTNNRTFAPSYLMRIKGNKTKILNDRLLGQGALVDNGNYYKTTPQSKFNG